MNKATDLIVPGPGQYQIDKIKNSSPSVSFTRENLRNSPNSKDNKPGPAHYFVDKSFDFSGERNRYNGFKFRFPQAK